MSSSFSRSSHDFRLKNSGPVLLMKMESELRYVLIVEKPFSQRDADRFGVTTISDSGFAVEVWDVGMLYARNYPRSNSVFNLHGAKILQLESFSHLESLSANLLDKDVIMGMAGLSIEQAWPYRRLRKIIFKTHARIATITNGHGPFDRWEGFWKKLARILVAPPGIYRQVRSLMSFLLYEAKMVVGNLLTAIYRHKLSYVFAGASYYGVDANLIGSDTKAFQIHGLDVDNFLRVEDEGEQQKNIVYLDSMGPLHPELVAYNLPFRMDTSDFYSLNLKCLKELQVRLGGSCVIAAHPKAQTGQLENFYDPYPVMYRSTAKLVAHSICVIGEPSLSLGMAAWFNKPAIMLWSKDLPDWMKQLIKDYQDALDCAVWNVDDKSTWQMPVVNLERYKTYRETYLKKPGTPNRLFWEFAAEKLQA